MVDDNYDSTTDARDGTIELVSAYVSNTNTRITGEELQTLIRETFATLSSLSVAPQAPAAEPSDVPAKSKVEIRKSIATSGLISFEDGKSYQSLKRHLSTRGMTPDDYRAKWGLPADYPMVHPAYSARRSELAKSMGLGAKGRTAKTRAPAGKAKTTRAPKSALK